VNACRRFARLGGYFQGGTLLKLQFAATIIEVSSTSAWQPQRVINPANIPPDERHSAMERPLDLGDLAELVLEVIAGLFDVLTLF